MARSVEQFVDMGQALLAQSDARIGSDWHWCVETDALRGSVRNIALAEDCALTITDLASDVVFEYRMSGATCHTVELGFCISGHMRVHLSGSRKDFDSIGGQCYFAAFSGSIGINGFLMPGAPFRLVELRYSAGAFARVATRLSASLQEGSLTSLLGDAEVKPGVRSPYKYAMLLTPAMRRSAEDVFNVCHAPTRARPRAAKLAAQMIAQLSTEMQPTHSELSPGDVQRVREAREVLMRELDEPPSICALARRVCLNDYKLKRGFRQVYGTTVYGVVREARLARAQELLQAGASVTRAASEVGYSNLSHFSAQFRKRFDQLPSQFCAGR